MLMMMVVTMMMMTITMTIMMGMRMTSKYLSQSSHCCIELSDPIPFIRICLDPSHLN